MQRYVGLKWLLVAGVCAALAAGPGLAQRLQPVTPAPLPAASAPVDETPELWFVELASPPAVDGTPLNTLRNEKAAFRRAAQSAGLRFTERYAFDTLWNGISLRVNRADIAKLSKIAGVAAIYPVGSIPIPTTQTVSDPNLATALAMTGADIAQSELGLSGVGVKVGIIDTGVDYDHPDLGGSGTPGGTAFPTVRVIAGNDFVGDAYNAGGAGDALVPHPDPNPDDCAGHGTHVAGIVGANGTVKGVAPQALLGAYRVFGCSGSTSGDVMIAAMERALADGMQVVNMSIGSAFQWPQYPTAAASTRLVNKGVVVVASIGNDAASGLYSASAPGLGSKVIGVASFDNNFNNVPVFTISPDNLAIGYTPAAAAPPAPTSGSAPMARTGTPATTNDACLALPAGSLAGQIALIRRGTCTFYLKASNAQAAGAVAVVLYNNVAGTLSPTVAGTPPVTIPVVAVTKADGETINGRIAAGGVTLTWTAQFASLPVATGGLISYFSSYGLSPDLALKPDLGAPGGYIRSTYPLELGAYANLSGTSMSSPHVAGAAALLLEKWPHTPSQAVRDILQNSASPKNWWGNPSLGFLDSTHRQGAGMLQIDKAALATTKIQPGKLSLGESQGGPVTQTLTIANNGTVPVTYNLASTPAMDNGPETYLPTFYYEFDTVAFSQSGVPITNVTVPAGGSANVDVTVTAPDPPLPDGGIYGGYLTINPNAGSEAFTVPYAGLKGDYQSLPALAPTTSDFPWLARLQGSSFVQQAPGATYTMAGGDLPYVLVHLDHQARIFRIEVFDATSGKAWHRAFEWDYTGRNSAPTSFYAIGWDGTTINGNKLNIVPNGQYVLQVSVLKALGDSQNPAHWETWNSPMFQITRP